MLEPPLHGLDGVASVTFIPAPVEVLGDGAELDDQDVREILRLDLPSFLTPQPNQRRLVVAHDDTGVRSTNEPAAVTLLFKSCYHPTT
jgi:hypothetical protein